MLLTSARVVPHSARARLVSLRGATVTLPSATVASTSPCTVSDSEPSEPLAVSTWPARSTVTPLGMTTGFLPMRDIGPSSEYPAQHLAADLGDAGFAVRHDPARGRQDGDAQAVIDPRQVGELGIDAAAGLRHARDLADHRLAIDVFQLDLQLRDSRADRILAEPADVPLAAQNLEHIGAQL